MSLSSAINKIINKKYFIENYEKLLIYSVQTQFQVLNVSGKKDDIDWGYLISCASLMAQTDEGKFLDMAYRICQTSLCMRDLPSEYHDATAAILNILSNFPAIKLAIERQYVQSSYISNVPIHYALDIKRKQFENTISDGDDFTHLNDFQKEVYDAFGGARVLSISAPTSAGKSFILMHLIKEYIESNKMAKIAYIIPTRALIQQVEFDVRTTIKKNGLKAEVTSIPLKPSTWENSACVTVFTQERLQWLMNEDDIIYDLIIVDEAQKVGDGSRGVLLQQVLQQTAENSSTRFIFASPMSENPGSLLKVVNYTEDISESNKQIISEIPTVNQNLIWVSKSTSSTTKWKLELLSNGKKMELGEISTQRMPNVGHRLPVLSFALSSDKGNLIYCNGAAEAEKVSVQIATMIKSNNQAYEPSERIKELIKLIKKTIHKDYVLTETLKSGVAFHYGNMPLGIRNEIEELFKLGDISFLICTSTLVEGVNLPAKTIFMRGPKKGNSTPMNEMDFWNLAGRAGRQGKEFQGNIVCLDVTDDIWKNGVPSERRKYHIKSSVDDIIDNSFEDLYGYIINTNETTSSDPRIDYAYTYFLSNYFKYGSILKSPLNRVYGSDVCIKLDEAFNSMLQNVELPADILSRNQGVNPLAQQKLLDYFKKENKDVDKLIPPYPEDDDAQEKYMHIIGRISQHITKESYKLNHSRSILVTNWMRGYGLARIISDNIKWNETHNTGKKLAAIIRETMKDVEEYARFRFLKYTTCYIDVLRYYLITNGKEDAIKDIPPLSLWLEFGASQITQISLMSMGFTRMTALELSELMVDTELDKESCIKWFENNNVHAMDISKTILLEIDKVLELQ